jgi:hypothetical protein
VYRFRQPLVGEDGRDNWWIIKCHKDTYGCLVQASYGCPQGYIVHQKDEGPINTFLVISCNGNSGHRAPSMADYSVTES